MEILGEDSEFLFMYEYIKEDKRCVSTHLCIGDFIYTTDKTMDKEFYKFIVTYRQVLEPREDCTEEYLESEIKNDRLY